LPTRGKVLNQYSLPSRPEFNSVSGSGAFSPF
jgi:hypothetical protein